MKTEEAARLAGVTFRQVSYWLQNGVIPPPRRESAGYGDFRYDWSTSDLARLRVVAQIMALGEAGERHAQSGETAKLVMRHWRKGPAWLVLSPLDGTGAMVMVPEKVPKAVRRVGGRALVVPLP